MEAVQKFSDPPLTECPHCGGELKRVFHPVGIVLKGSGFYATDSRSNKALSPTKKDGEKTADSKPAESKPADKPAKTDKGGTTGSKKDAAAS